MLFGGDAYVIKYKYMENNRDKYIIYFWQVLLTKIRNDWHLISLMIFCFSHKSGWPMYKRWTGSFGPQSHGNRRRARRCSRASQSYTGVGAETFPKNVWRSTRHSFRRKGSRHLFPLPLCCLNLELDISLPDLKGNPGISPTLNTFHTFPFQASGFKNVHDHDTYDVDGTRLFRVRGICEQDVRTVQIQPEKASSLDTDDAFILEYKDQNLWVSQTTNFLLLKEMAIWKRSLMSLCIVWLQGITIITYSHLKT